MYRFRFGLLRQGSPGSELGRANCFGALRLNVFFIAVSHTIAMASASAITIIVMRIPSIAEPSRHPARLKVTAASAAQGFNWYRGLDSNGFSG